MQIPYNAALPDLSDSILPLCAERSIGVVVMVPFGAGRLVQNPPPPEALQPLQPYGITTWGQALLKWVLSDPRVHVVIPATRRPRRMAETIAAGSPPWFPAEVRAYVTELARRHT